MFSQEMINLFLQLKRLSVNDGASTLRTKDTVEFVPGNALLQTERALLHNNLRYVDGKEDSSNAVKSHGESWLDKD